MAQCLSQAQQARSISMSDDPKHPKDDNKTPPKKPQKDLHRPEATLDEAPAGSPNAEERSRLSD